MNSDTPMHTPFGPNSTRPADSSLLVLGAICLGIALQTRDGLITPAGLGLLAGAIGCIIAALMTPSVRWIPAVRWPLAHRIRLDLLLMSLTVPLYFALMFAMRPGVYMKLDSAESYRTFQILLALAAVTACSALLEKPPLGRLTLPLILLLHLSLGAWVIRHSPSPSIDVYIFQRDAAEAILHGHNPYAMTFPNLYGQGTWLYAADVQQNDRLLFGYPYMPLTLLFTTPAHWLFHDYRYGQLIALSLSAALIALARPGRASLLAAILLLFTPRLFFILEQGWTEPILVLLLAGTVFCAMRLPRVMPCMLGLFLVSKQYLPSAFLLVPLLIPREHRRSWKHWWPILWRAAATGAAVTLPLVLLDPPAFWHSAISLQFKQPFRFDALSFLAALCDVKYIPGQPPQGTPPPGAAMIAFIALAIGAAAALWRGRPSPRSFAAGVALMFVLFFAFNKQAFANYYFFVIGALWCAVGMAGPIAGEDRRLK